MYFAMIEQQLKQFNETPQSIVHRYEQLQQHDCSFEEHQQLQAIFNVMYYYLKTAVTSQRELNMIARHPNELIEWFVFQCYYRGYGK
ncbi:hypothetical protein [Staphylococcus simiae]|uniref:Uncharacterized protein n=1 Tax=Staphylococcus simiae CCM 7213 = CCUG 51256 TaxID=911238 RepID=G5JI30_9STAP|nr:hypothetical protein [Staphylococcus simiae]EHJ08147.1 hypothetical protein SS7213T_05561 [Staphylococcus simiae CCM 7213 = CCUG 51256]PNZ14774.1 hypothetical protein CD113_00955 [Staphylococcus simiae]SNV82139.1 Uncharacterised protein [Staphylococcus simiae]